jgi:hypothetical protein
MMSRLDPTACDAVLGDLRRPGRQDRDGLPQGEDATIKAVGAKAIAKMVMLTEEPGEDEQILNPHAS